MLSESSMTMIRLVRPFPASHPPRPVGESTGRAIANTMQHDDQRANRQQNQLLDAQPPAIGFDRQLQILHRRPFHELKPPAIQQMDNDRHGRQCQKAEEEWER